MLAAPRAKSRGYRPNAIGVTAISVVNGRGAYGSRRRARKLSRLERGRRASGGKGSMLKNARGPRARFVKVKANGRSRSGQRLAAYRTAQRRGLSERSAARAALRHVPFTQSERKHGRRFKGVRQRVRRNFAGDAATYAAWNETSGAAPQRKRTRIPMPKGYKRGKKKAKRATKRKTARRASSPKRRYRRLSLTNPKTGRKQKSYVYRTKSGRRRKVPAWVTAGAKSARDYKSSGKYTKARERIAARRRRAAARVESGQDAFTPNAGARKVKKTKRKGRKGARKAGAKKKTRRAGKRTTARKKKKTSKRKAAKKGGHRKSAKRVRAGKKAARTRAAKKAARRAAAKKAARKRRGGGKRKASSRKKSTRKASSRRKSSGHKKLTRRQRAARKGARTRRRNQRARAAGALGSGMSSISRNGRRRGKMRRNTKRRSLRANRRGAYRQNRRTNRRRGRSMRRNLRRNSHRRRYRRNGFKTDVGMLFKAGALVLGGFFAHKALTGVLAKALVNVLPVTDASGAPTALAVWQKPIAGLPVLAVGLFGASKMKNEKAKMSLGAGLVTSWLQSIVQSGLTAMNQPQVLAALEGYQNSSAYRLRGMGGMRRRRGMRGLGVARNTTSIMPQYAPVGQYRQAAAGTGEYFSSNGMGEYFASNGVQGVGAYEKAGPLALQPTNSRMGNLPIDDGIRPDSDLEHIMDLAESAAGLGGGGYRQAAAGVGRYRQAAAGVGEYYSAQAGADGSFSEFDIPQQSQWIPNGPMWAGSMTADDRYTESELPAGVLQGPGGNGVLSG